jgi:hypothetical protein
MKKTAKIAVMAALLLIAAVNVSWSDSDKTKLGFSLSREKNPYEASFPAPFPSSLTDTTKFNKYGYLRNDDPLFNKKSSLGMVALRVTLANITTMLINRYLFNFEYARVGIQTWKHNIQTGWEWDSDRFGTNYFMHPMSGAYFFNAARANGFSFFESAPFALLGSLEWEYFGETTLPSYNDVINTPINGIFLGEILYRLGSNLLDDRTTGASRFFRELAVGLMTPTRFFSRLFSGKLGRATSEDVYQKEPLYFTLSVGYHRINNAPELLTGSDSMNFNFIFDYGDPFEKRSRKPYDYFKLRTDFDFGVGNKIIDNISGYGLLAGSNVQTGNLEMLIGLFQHMNFFNNRSFELGTIAFGPGVLSKLPISGTSYLFTNLHVAIVPFAGLSRRFGPENTLTRDYSYGGGAEMTLESTFNIGGWADLTFLGYYWWFHAYIGDAGNSYLGLIKPRVSFKLLDNVSIGFEHLIYNSHSIPRDFPSVHSIRTEEKLFLQIFI